MYLTSVTKIEEMKRRMRNIITVKLTFEDFFALNFLSAVKWVFFHLPGL